jgi:hypothetical protein
MLRIMVDESADAAIVSLHGWLSSAEVVEMEGVVCSQRRPVTVELSQLVGVDKVGLRALLRLRRGGTRLAAASPFIELMLERAAETDSEEPAEK